MHVDLFNLILSKKLKSVEKLNPGEYQVKGEVVVSIDAIVRKSKDEEYTPTSSIPWPSVLAVFVKKYNIKQKELEDVILEAFNESKENDVNIADSLAFTQRSLTRIQNTLAKLPKETKSGKTMINGVVRVIKIIGEKVEKV